MTAEIAVMNKSAIALAADSKVTISSATGEKTFDTVNKVFTLSKVHPVGVMVFGNAEFMRFPWETIVKLYRSNKKSQHEPTVAKWADDFIRYVSGFGTIRKSDKQENINEILSSWFRAILVASFDRAQEESISVPSEEYFGILTRLINQQTSRLKRADKFMSDAAYATLARTYGEVFEAAVARSFGAFDRADIGDALAHFMPEALTRQYTSPVSSGIVIAGFGDDEIFPTLVSYETDGYVGNRIRLVATHSIDVRREMSSAIVPFAQSDMAQRFMDGVDPEYSKYLRGLFVRTLVSNCLEVLERYGQAKNKIGKIKTEIREAALASVREDMKKAQEYSSNRYARPIVQIVSLLPKDELPHLAESLVALTSLKRHVSSDAETVGGPIDVALISKSDGFVWIKRKHYFKPELNPQFTLNYMRDVNTTGDRHDRNPQKRNTTASKRARRTRAKQ